ncbi:MAG TPA: L-glutamate gamma-semialdehyde dehydrogenase [Thermoanaerobaculia bacterium]|nr:L-glutamate gamma-semialdehyde dehydrogenase [Thermoanaerobaculia bacterium]
MLPEFQNEPLTDFRDDANRRAFVEALKRVEAKLPIAGKILIGGKWSGSAKTFESVNPCEPKQVIGRFPSGTVADAGRALDAATKAFPAWSRFSPQERAAVVLKIAAILRRRKHDFSAMMVLEESKSWPEADGDTAEAIDFCEFYAREAERLGQPQALTPYPSERNELDFIPLGVCAVIPPWNFPLAILAGMTTAALVTGNTVVLKPSSDAAGIATMFVQACEEAGVPDGVLNFVPGGGSTVGNALVESPKTRLIAFTGSRGVGVEISEKAGRVAPGQIWIKRAVLEMGGKDFILVDETANLEEAAAGAVAAAFGFQGQKCSACSRLIVHRKVHKELLARVVAKTKALSVGDVRDPRNNVGAVINAAAQKKILDYVAIGRKEGKIVAGGKAGPKSGYYVMPTVVDGIRPKDRLAQEEIFGPVLAVIAVKSFDEGIQVANGTEYGLTGSLYSRDRARLDRGKRELFCGNLYLNRKCTGALVGVHPFGGFNMSGTDSKAGGREYLYLFTQAKAISEKL